MSDVVTIDGSLTVPDLPTVDRYVAALGYPTLVAALDATLGLGADADDYGCEAHPVDQQGRPGKTTLSVYGTVADSLSDFSKVLEAISPVAVGTFNFQHDPSSSLWRTVVDSSGVRDEIGEVRYVSDQASVETGTAVDEVDLSQDNSTAQEAENEAGVTIPFTVATFVSVPPALVDAGSAALVAWVAQALQEGRPCVSHKVTAIG